MRVVYPAGDRLYRRSESVQLLCRHDAPALQGRSRRLFPERFALPALTLLEAKSASAAASFTPGMHQSAYSTRQPLLATLTAFG